jgi:hypothetical protein
MPYPDSEYPSILRGKDKRESQRLLAAADGLLTALKMIRVQFGDYRDGDGAAKYHACNVADAAIAKAEGRE